MTDQRPRQRHWLMILPATGVTGGLLAAGLTMAARESVGLADADGVAIPTLVHFRDVLRDPEFHAGLALSIWVASVTTAMSVIGGVAIAVVLRPTIARRRAMAAFLQLPLGLPHLAVAIATLTLAAPTGLAARIAFGLGLIAGPDELPAVLYDRYGLGIILSYTVKEVPFLAVVTTALLQRLDQGHAAVAQTLGASAWQRFRYVTWPLVAPGVGSTAMMVFAFVFSAFETPFLMGRPYPAMLSVLAQQRYMTLEHTDRPAAVAMALIMTAIVAAIVWWHLRPARTRLPGARPAVF